MIANARFVMGTLSAKGIKDIVKFGGKGMMI